MSTKQANLDEFAKPKRPATGGYKDSDRPCCGITKTATGEPCERLAIPTIGVCHRHLEHSDLVEASSTDGDRPVWDRKRPGGSGE